MSHGAEVLNVCEATVRRAADNDADTVLLAHLIELVYVAIPVPCIRQDNERLGSGQAIIDCPAKGSCWNRSTPIAGNR